MSPEFGSETLLETLAREESRGAVFQQFIRFRSGLNRM
ncbi:hypothetical protein RBSH_02234 [Rhodopirellula baltica SH28]|uniref:Uncharacterized protein n=3 Tax=Rhodopirellula baltica TaxID=265606 RepID=F2ASV7_RHOBT|nr:hypothetical protein RBWH47_00656 [Rhodopirellula baltica WH47]EKK02600.1 hypothetical protein RBSH_02234 [Rhodopirellula baltica SH28]ELP35001.1 hypothetical protein RBSWK_01001 [Rhodopirellula baltica SWK14]